MKRLRPYKKAVDEMINDFLKNFSLKIRICTLAYKLIIIEKIGDFDSGIFVTVGAMH